MEAKAFILSALDKAKEKVSDTRFALEFLASPKELLGDEDGRVRAVEVNETTLELREGGGSKAVNVGSTREIEVDTVVFCIGDKVDAAMGLPLDKWKEFAKHPKPQYPVDDKSYEAYDPENDEGVEGIFLAGWAREASSGLVGAARKDGTNGAKAIFEYLQASGKGSTGALRKLEARLSELDKPVIRATDIKKLEAAEAAQAGEQGLEEFKYAANADMLSVMELDKVKEKA